MLKTVLIAAVLEVAVLYLQVHSAPLDLPFGDRFTRSAVNQPINETRPMAAVCDFNSVTEILRKNATLMEAVREALSPNRVRGHSLSVDYLRVILIEENATQEEWIWSTSSISLYFPPRFAFTGLFNFGWWPNINKEPNITLCIPQLCSERRDYLQERLVQKLQSLVAGGSGIVDGPPSAFSLKVGPNGTLATYEGLSPGQLSDAQKVFMPLVYMFVAVVVCFRCKAFYSGDAWFYKRKDVKEKMETPSAWCCTSRPNPVARQDIPLQPMGSENENNNDETSLLSETPASTKTVHDKALLRKMSMILAFQLLATLLSVCLGYEMIFHYMDVYSSGFTTPFVFVTCLWGLALLALAIGVVCYTCVQQCCSNRRHLNLCGTYCGWPICHIICCCTCDINDTLYLIIPFSSIVDIVLTIGIVHFLAYITSVSLLFLLMAFLRNWLLTFYIAVTNVSCFIVLLVPMSEVAFLLLQLKLGKPTPGLKGRGCLLVMTICMAIVHRAAAALSFIILSIAACIIYLHPHYLYNRLSVSPMFTPMVAIAATILVFYAIIRRYHIFPFNKDTKEYITKENE